MYHFFWIANELLMITQQEGNDLSDVLPDIAMADTSVSSSQLSATQIDTAEITMISNIHLNITLLVQSDVCYKVKINLLFL